MKIDPKQRNQYGLYPVIYCRSTGLPMFQRDNYTAFAERYLSRSRCKAAGRPVAPGEQPVAWYRCQNGYCPLYDRTEAPDAE